MDWLKISLIVVILLVGVTSESTPEVQYTHKFIGPHKDDYFGVNIVTTHGRVIISAPGDVSGKDTGALYVGRGKSVVAPDGGDGARAFGWRVDSNEEYMVVAGYKHPAIYVYQTNKPYELKARFPVDKHDFIRGVVIDGSNTIGVLRHYVHSATCSLIFYSYDGQSSWHQGQKLSLGRCERSTQFDDTPFNFMTMSGDSLAVSLYYRRYYVE